MSEAHKAEPTEISRTFGQPPPAVNYWGIHRRIPVGEGPWKRLKHAGDGDTWYETWPLAELSKENVVARWGAGEFRVCWFVIDPNGEKAIVAKGSGKVVMYEPKAEPVPVPPPQVHSHAQPDPLAAFPGLGPAFGLMSLMDQRSSQQMQSTIQMAQALGGGGQNQMMMMLFQDMKEQRAADALRWEQFTASQNAQLAQIRVELAGGGEEDGAIAGVAKAAAPVLFKPGKPIVEGLKAALANYAAENPDKLLELVKHVPAILEAVKKVAAPDPAPAPPPPVAPVQLAMASVVPIARPKAQAQRRPQPTGLNSLFSDAPTKNDSPAAE